MTASTFSSAPHGLQPHLLPVLVALLTAAPFADKHAFDRAALVAGIHVDRAPALCRPAHDLDRARVGIIDELAIALQRVGSGIDDVHCDAPQARGQRRVEIVEGVRRGRFRGSVFTHADV